MPGQLFCHLDGSNHISYDENEKRYEGRGFKKQYLKGCTKLIANSTDQITMFLSYSGNEFLTLYFIGFNSTTEEYAAIVTVFACLNIIINKVILSLTASLQSLLKEALRQHHYQKIHIYIKKTTVILATWTIFSLLILNLFAASLEWLKFPQKFRETTQLYFFLLSPYYIFHIPYSLMRSLYLSHGNLATPAFLNLAKLILNIVFNTFFFAKFGPNLLWTAFFKVLIEATVTAFFYLYAQENRFFIHAFTQNWNRQIFKNLARFAHVLMVKGSFIYFDRIICDISTIIAAFQHQHINVIVQSCLAAYTSCWLSFPFGIISTTSQNIRSAIREGSECQARTNLLRGAIICFVIGAFYTSTNPALSYYLPKLLWKNPQFQATFRELLGPYPLILWAEIGFNLMNILFRNLGQKKVIWKCLIVSSFLVGVPTSLAFGLKFPQTLQGIFAGRIISLLCTYVILIKKLLTLDWWASVRRVYFSHNNEEILLEI